MMNRKIFYKKYLKAFFSVFFTLVLWEFISRFNFVNEIFISSPSRVFAEGIIMIGNESFWMHFFSSMKALLPGYFFAVLLGASFGIFIGGNEKIYDYFKPHVFILGSLPLISIMPLIIIWFGIGISSKIFIIFILSLSPILINTVDGARNVDKALLEMTHSFGANTFFNIRKVIFFHSLPFIFSGMRIAIGRAMVGLIISEAFGYSRGLGFLIVHYGGIFQTGRLIFIVFVILAMAIMGTATLSYLEKKAVFWK